MMQTLDLRDSQPSRVELARLIPRSQVDVTSVVDVARDLINDVRERGVEAILDQAERFDGVRPQAVRVHAEEIATGMSRLDPAVRDALEESIDRVTKATQAQVPGPIVTQLAPGAE